MDEREKNTRRPIRREGAEYIPGGHKPRPDMAAADMGETRKISAPPIKPSVPMDGSNTRMVKTVPKKSAANKLPVKKVPPKKTNYAIVMVTAVFTAVIAAVFVVVFLLRDWEPQAATQNQSGQNGMVNNVGGGDSNHTGDGTSTNNTQIAADPASANWVGLIQNITGNRIDVYVFELEEVRSFFVDGTSSLRDRLNNAITITEFAKGNVIEIAHPANTNNITTARLSAETRSYQEIHGVEIVEIVEINLTQNMLQIGNRRYSLQAHPDVRYRGAVVDVSTIDPIDIVTIGIFQDTYVTSINILHSHGDITINSNEAIPGGMIEIENVATGSRIISPFEDGQSITLRVLTGQNRISVRGEYIEPYVVETHVAQGANVAVALDNLELRTGNLTVNTSVQDAIMFIGDRWFPVNEEIELPLGSHTIIIEAPGYQIFTYNVEITNEPQTINPSFVVATFTRSITFATNPSEARVYIDGTFRGLSPLTLDLELGRHTVTILRMGFLGTQPQPIQVTMDSDDIFNFMLHPDPAWPNLN